MRVLLVLFHQPAGVGVDVPERISGPTIEGEDRLRLLLLVGCRDHDLIADDDGAGVAESRNLSFPNNILGRAPTGRSY